MKIGIIGSSISGLIAGQKLAKAGHDVTVIEQSSTLGYRLATKQDESGFFDYGVPYLTAESDEFQAFVDELVEKNVLHEWADEFSLFDGFEFHKQNPNEPEEIYYASENGMQAVADSMKRWVDVKLPVRVGGLTHIGADREKKRSWMINLTDISVFECDAVIIATDAVNCYGILQTTQDETAARRLARVVDEIEYRSRYALMASYDDEPPAWKGVKCEKSDLAWIGNDTSKSERQKNIHMTIHSSADFARRLAGEDTEAISDKLLEKASQITGSEINPTGTALHHWKYYEAINTIDEYFMELEMDEAPLAIVGDYFSDTTIEAAYLSGYHLAEYWINKYEEVVV